MMQNLNFALDEYPFEFAYSFFFLLIETDTLLTVLITNPCMAGTTKIVSYDDPLNEIYNCLLFFDEGLWNENIHHQKLSNNEFYNDNSF